MKESQEQTFLFQWANLARCEYPELELMYHIPNGGKRNAREAAGLKRQGVKAGVPDICLPVPRGKYHGLYIELKVGKNKTSKHQDEWIEKLRNENYCVEVSYGWQEARDTIEDYLEGLM